MILAAVVQRVDVVGVEPRGCRGAIPALDAVVVVTLFDGAGESTVPGHSCFTETGAKTISLLGTTTVPRTGPMPETSKTTVSQDKDGYYRTRIPKALGDAMDLADSKVVWEVESKNSLKLTKVDD